MSTGIDNISLYTSSFYLDMHTLSAKRHIEYSKYTEGIGIERISIPAPDEDIITLAANAALPVVERCDKTKIGTLLFATESGVDQSKSAAVFVHRLLD
ncbi:MAG: hydroxymethylglutaryl-CoA synthase, partial [Spirochaetia bacterium]|nr:hydroxymethylglutaryl-CoA synthase [Spirochaetia bacterium]MBR5016719.1 hydroxymethylglutaryl-CoA synthase [Spirochaetia bacterium]